MIAHRIERKPQAASSSSKLIRYILASQGSSNPSTWQRTADYLLDSAHDRVSGEKVASYRISHCSTQDPADATLQILATQAANTRSRADKTYHLVYAFPPEEHPETSVLHAIEDALCQAIGLGAHQRISAVHVDRDHLHVHVAINKVHPSSFQNIEPYYDKRRLMEACVRLEQQYGLQRTDHGLSPTPDGKDSSGSAASISSKAAKMQAYSGVQTLGAQEGQKLASALRQAKNWQEVHRLAARQGLVVCLRGAGLVMGAPQTNRWTKASHLGRDLSYKALTDRLGPFQAPQGIPHTAEGLASGQTHTPLPVQQTPTTAPLFAHYQQERQAALQARQQAMKQLRHERHAFKTRMKHWHQQQRMLFRVVIHWKGRQLLKPLLEWQVRTADQYNRQRLETQCRSLLQQAPLPTWMDWLSQQAQQGNADALAVLRTRAQRADCWKRNLLKSESAAHARAVLLKSLQPKVRRDGSIIYRTADGGQVIDRHTGVQARQATSGAVLVALELATQRFTGQRLQVEGTETFKQEVAHLAGLHGLRVQFADPVLEQKRQAHLKNKRLCSEETDRSRLWQPSDAGSVRYQGHRRERDGTDVLLLKRGDELLLKPITLQVAAQASAWPLGKVLVLDKQGHLNPQRSGLEH